MSRSSNFSAPKSILIHAYFTSSVLSGADGPADGGMTLTYDTTTLTSSGQTISYIAGSLLVVTCNADCNEACTYVWRKSPQTSSTLSSTANLTLPNIQLSDEGSYVCTAINTRGSSTTSFSLLVTGECVEVCVFRGVGG